MSQERWDVVLRFLNGPLMYQGDLVLRGPVIRIGANPGPGGLKMEGYRGLDDRQAVVTAYDGGTVSIAPVGPNQVRMAPHEHVDWNEVQPIRGPVFLSNGCAVHFGPPGRGATAVFVECRRLGVWQQGAILSEAAGASPEIQESEVKELDAGKRFPWWIIPAFLSVLVTFLGALGILVFFIVRRDVQALGPTWEGKETYEFAEALTEEVNLDLYKGVEQAYYEFVMKPNIAAAGWKELENHEKWDKVLMQNVTRAEALHGKGWTFWTQLDNARDDYALVLGDLRKEGLPDVLAAIPFQESRYKDAKDVAYCARGYWQFQPEIAFQAGITVRDCKLRGSSSLWSPTQPVPPRNLRENAVYTMNDRCLIDTCAVDDRGDIRQSTKGAMKLLGEVLADDELKFSGAVTQIAIASHNAGYNHSRFYTDGRVNKFNMLPAYREFVAEQKVERAPDFIGANITCTEKGQIGNQNNRCGGKLGSITQYYVPYVIAQHLLAVCYYGKNYADDNKAFSDYRQFLRGNGYCTDIKVPTREEVAQRASGGKK